MANMSYCRFRNTENDLRECMNALEDGTFLEGDELSAYESLMSLAEELVNFSPGPLEEDPDEEEE